jgi:hypothetical protein
MKPSGKDGTTGLSWGDFLLITDILDNGDIKYAQALFVHKETKNRKQQLQLQRENMTIDAKNAQKTAMVKTEEAKKLEVFKTDELARLDKIKTDNLLRIKEKEHEYKMEEIGKKEQAGTIRDGFKEMNTSVGKKESALTE